MVRFIYVKKRTGEFQQGIRGQEKHLEWNLPHNTGKDNLAQMQGFCLLTARCQGQITSMEITSMEDYENQPAQIGLYCRYVLEPVNMSV